jgi:hypothetical protein
MGLCSSSFCSFVKKNGRCLFEMSNENEYGYDFASSLETVQLYQKGCI